MRTGKNYVFGHFSRRVHLYETINEEESRQGLGKVRNSFLTPSVLVSKSLIINFSIAITFLLTMIFFLQVAEGKQINFLTKIALYI